jgi:hypothetical protein
MELFTQAEPQQAQAAVVVQELHKTEVRVLVVEKQAVLAVAVAEVVLVLAAQEFFTFFIRSKQ